MNKQLALIAKHSRLVTNAILLTLTTGMLVVNLLPSHTIPDTLLAYNGMKQTVEEQDILTHASKEARRQMNQSIAEFKSSRSFELDHSDVDRILAILSAVSGIQVTKAAEVDPRNFYQEVGEYTPGSTPEAIKLELTVTDVTSALKAISHAQLAIQSITVINPTYITIVLLTGGESSEQ